MAPSWPARPGKSQEHRAQGNGRRGIRGNTHAHGSARRIVAGIRPLEKIRQGAVALIGKDLNNVEVIEYRTRFWCDGPHEMVQLYEGIDEFAEVVQSDPMRDGKEKFVDFDGVRFLQVM